MLARRYLLLMPALPALLGNSLIRASLICAGLLCASLLATGCSQLRGRPSQTTGPTSPSSAWPTTPPAIVPATATASEAPSTADFNAGRPRIKLVYASDSGRLNLLALAGPQTNRLASHESTTSSAVPEFARCRLALVSPHPHGKAGYALASLVVLPESDEPTGLALGALWADLTGDDTRRTRSKDSALEAWTMDLPQWQVEQLVERLKRDDFFKRQRVFDAEVELTTEINGSRFAKSSPPIAELDSLIFRVRREGRLLRRKADAQASVASRGELPELLRLPSVGY